MVQCKVHGGNLSSLFSGANPRIRGDYAFDTAPLFGLQRTFHSEPRLKYRGATKRLMERRRMNTKEPNANEKRVLHDADVLKQYGLRWAVLAGWRDALNLRKVRLEPNVDHLLESARMKISSGCFSVCEVGCDLSQLEGVLTSADASTDHNWVEFWVDMLANAMKDNTETERILKIPAVRTRYINCGLAVCRC